jgi:hypothetical protein
MNMGKLALIASLLLGLAACAASSDASAQAAQGGSLSEIVLGFWHGLIAPVTLIGEIIEALAPTVLPWTFRIYETQNTGVLYDVGFVVGLVGGPSLLFTSRRRLVRA